MSENVLKNGVSLLLSSKLGMYMWTKTEQMQARPTPWNLKSKHL
jgi:hypothetical protein